MEGHLDDFDEIDEDLLRSLPLDIPFQDEDLSDHNCVVKTPAKHKTCKAPQKATENVEKDTDSGVETGNNGYASV